jgi:hypothetical protein
VITMVVMVCSSETSSILWITDTENQKTGHLIIIAVRTSNRTRGTFNRRRVTACLHWRIKFSPNPHVADDNSKEIPSDNAPNLYSKGARVESRLTYWLHWGFPWLSSVFRLCYERFPPTH